VEWLRKDERNERAKKSETAAQSERNTQKVFQEWFDYEIQTMVYDMTPDKPLEHED
jgi:hypothetical protein